VVADSWLRSVAAGVDVDASEPPITLDRDLLTDYRAQHPLAKVFPLLYDVLGRAAEDCDSVMAVTDARCQLLWVRGKPWVLRQAESIRFVEGAQWDEGHAGTNAPGTALRLDAPVTITSAEHFVRPVQRWNCAAVPVHDPDSGTILGVIDITGGQAVDTPQTIAMVRAAARMAEAELARDAAVAAARLPQPRQVAASSRAQSQAEISLSALGRSECVISTGTATFRLSPRHSEIMVILASCPGGLTGDELAYMLYPADVAARRAGPAAGAARRPAVHLTSLPADLRGQVGLGRGVGAAHGGQSSRGPAAVPRAAAAAQRSPGRRRAAGRSRSRPASRAADHQPAGVPGQLDQDPMGAVLPPQSPLGPSAAAPAAKLDAEFGL
jgi:hypothetical protein